jgi:histidinol-phosphate phosphatase family domain/HAD-superfamily hydrolase, subfamily IIIA
MNRKVVFDKSWTLFLDRDGVINYEIHGQYVLNIEQFKLYEHLEQYFHRLNTIFSKVIVVTNQRGISKGLMTEQDLHLIHKHLQLCLKAHQGNIDGFYFAKDMDDNAINRKPNIGMALQAKRDFPSIDFKKSVMIGNNLSDMQFGKNAGMYTVFLTTTQALPSDTDLIDESHKDMVSFIQTL